MAKKPSESTKKQASSRTDAVRQAVDQAFQTQVPRDRIAELVDELASTAGRLRGAVDELRPASAEELKALRADLNDLAGRVAALEQATAAKPEPAPKPKRAPAKRAAAKPAASSSGSATTKAKAGAARRAASERAAGRRRSTTKRTSS